MAVDIAMPNAGLSSRDRGMEKPSFWLGEDLTMSFERHKGTVPPRPVVHLSGIPENPRLSKGMRDTRLQFPESQERIQTLGFSVLWQLPIFMQVKGSG
jgi:hypothetical protein